MRRAAVGCILALWLVLGAGSSRPCAQQAAPGAQFTDGHVYLAPLMKLHPLYPDLLRLEQAIQELMAPEAPMRVAQFGLGGTVGGEYVAGPVLVSWPDDVWRMRVEPLVAGLQREPTDAQDALPPDLATELDWKRRETLRRARGERQRAEADLSREFADTASRLYRENQERMTALSTYGGEGGSPDELRAQLEGELEKMQQQHALRLEELEASLQERVESALAEAERAVERKARTRSRRSVPGAETLRREMVSRAESFPLPEWLKAVSVEVPGAEVGPQADIEAETARVEEQRGAARRAAAEDLGRRRDQLSARIIGACRLAASKIARDRRLRLQIAPIGDASGPDLTAQIGEQIHRLWAGGHAEQP